MVWDRRSHQSDIQTCGAMWASPTALPLIPTSQVNKPSAHLHLIVILREERPKDLSLWCSSKDSSAAPQNDRIAVTNRASPRIVPSLASMLGAMWASPPTALPLIPTSQFNKPSAHLHLIVILREERPKDLSLWYSSKDSSAEPQNSHLSIRPR
jgi:hypothetical protein